MQPAVGRLSVNVLSRHAADCTRLPVNDLGNLMDHGGAAPGLSEANGEWVHAIQRYGREQ
jgi:hypothetical protein